MDLRRTDEQDTLCRDVTAFATANLASDMVARDRTGAFSRDLWTRCAGFGIQGLPFPKEHGGSGRDALTTVMAMEALGHACVDNGLVFGIGAQMWSVQMPISRFGTESQKAAFLVPLCTGTMIGAHAMTEPSAGSDAFALATTARREGTGYRLDGAKTFITHAPHADVFVTFAREPGTEGALGISAFLVERDRPGLQVGEPIEKMGLRTVGMAEVRFDGCVVPESNLLGQPGKGAAIFLDSMEWERAGIMAGAVGAMARLVEQSMVYTRDRQQFGQPVAWFGTMQERLVHMKAALERSRLMLYRAIWAKLHNEPDASGWAALAKLQVSQDYRQVALDAAELRGGQGYRVDAEVEREVRDALAALTYSGTADMQRQAVARWLGIRRRAT